MAANNGYNGRGKRVEQFGLVRKDLHFLPSDIKIVLPYVQGGLRENELICRTILSPIADKPGKDEAINWYAILPTQGAYVTLMTMLEQGAPERTDVPWLSKMRQSDMFIDNLRAEGLEPRTIEFLGVVTIDHKIARTEIMRTFEAADRNIGKAGRLKVEPADGQLFRNCVRHNPVVRAHQHLLDTRAEEMGNASIKCLYFITDGYNGSSRNLPFGVPRLHLVTVLERASS